MKFDFTGKRVLITGSTVGIGRAIAEAFLDTGATVVINGRSEGSVAKAIKEMGDGDRLLAMPADLSIKSERDTAVQDMLRELGGIDIVVNNAGRGDDCMLEDITDEYVENMLDLNLKAVFFTSKLCMQSLLENKGCIVNISSGLGLIGGPPASALYTVAKTALVQMTRMMALELATSGVRVNCLCPGWINTPMIQHENELAGDNALYEYIDQTTPVGRIGTAEECAGAVLYFAAPFSSFTTGAVLSADGGLTAGRYL